MDFTNKSIQAQRNGIFKQITGFAIDKAIEDKQPKTLSDAISFIQNNFSLIEVKPLPKYYFGQLQGYKFEVRLKGTQTTCTIPIQPGFRYSIFN